VLGPLGEQLRGTEQTGDVDIVSAGVHHWHLASGRVGRGGRAGVGQTSRLLDG